MNEESDKNDRESNSPHTNGPELPEQDRDSEAGDERPGGPGSHERMIDGRRYFCTPKVDGRTYVPPGRTEPDENGNEYWCVPYEIAFPDRQFDQGGRKDPNNID
ncbi:hypothetical protein AB1L30_14060 [Bremerella sp. JC817]|uniref:hypothetical protein n=1 Tax=Bremerella sp. JC817 TaxID=3231756 RepID=UPI0034589EBF